MYERCTDLIICNIQFLLSIQYHISNFLYGFLFALIQIVIFVKVNLFYGLLYLQSVNFLYFDSNQTTTPCQSCQALSVHSTFKRDWWFFSVHSTFKGIIGDFLSGVLVRHFLTISVDILSVWEFLFFPLPSICWIEKYLFTFCACLI